MNTREIYIEITPGLDAEALKDAMYPASHDDPDAGCLLHEVAYAFVFADGNDRDEVYDIEIDDIRIDPAFPSQVEFEFTVSWGHHSSCKDMQTSGHDQFVTTATYTAEGQLIFYVPDQHRFSNPC